MNTLIDNDWQKNAAAATQSDADVEKAFLDQAWMQIQNKATPLMKAQHRVGFEVVHKNDENTRMVGVFVFRINKDYLFAPVFFINGSIKGTDLLYRSNNKKFIPLNNEWCEYLIQLQNADEGQGVSQRQRQMVRDQLNLIDIVEPPQMSRYIRKYASVCADGNEESAVRANITEMLEKLANIPSLNKESILRRFILNHGGHDAIRKIANTAKHDYEFARALMVGSDPENYMPEIKSAAAKPSRGPLVVVHTSVLRNKQVKQASPKEMCQGYRIEDHRKEAEINEVVYTDNTQDLNTVEAPGVYDVLLADGTNSKCLVAFEFDVDSLSGCPSPVSFTESYDPARPRMNRQTLVIVDIGSRASDTMRPSEQQWVFGKYDGKIEDSGELIAMGDAKVGEAYRIYNSSNQGMTRPFYVAEVNTDPSGLKAIKTCDYNTGSVNSRAILVNPDFADYDAKDNIFGATCKLVKVGFELGKPFNSADSGKPIDWNRTLGLGNKHTLNAFIFENNFKTASVKRQSNGTFLVKSARTGGKWTPELSEASAKIRIMLDCGLREPVAEELLKQATETTKSSVDVLYDATKIAHNLRFNDWPEFYDRMNNEFNVLEAPRSEYVMNVEEDKPIPQRHRVGDVWRQEGDSPDTMDTLNPMELYGLAQEKGIGSLFEHGVVGELVKTYDAISMVQSYVPDFEQALDRLGRILFLFYWKPEDFAQAYGTDDQTSLENKLLSNFRAIGEMTLELLQKAKLQQEGSVSLT